MPLRPLLLAVAAATALSAAPGAHGALANRTEIVMATGACQAALPAFEGQIRKRPLAVQNEGTASAFVSCGFEGTGYLVQQHATRVGVYLNNVGTAAAVTCTLVDGRGGFNNPAYFPKTLQLPVTSGAILMEWTAADNAGEGFVFPGVSCNLPPGVGINSTVRGFSEEIGS